MWTVENDKLSDREFMEVMLDIHEDNQLTNENKLSYQNTRALKDDYHRKKVLFHVRIESIVSIVIAVALVALAVSKFIT